MLNPVQCITEAKNVINHNNVENVSKAVRFSCTGQFFSQLLMKFSRVIGKIKLVGKIKLSEKF